MRIEPNRQRAEPSPHFVTDENASGLSHTGSVEDQFPILSRAVWNCAVDTRHWIGFSTETVIEGIAQGSGVLLVSDSPSTALPSLSAHGSPTGVSVAVAWLALSALGLRAGTQRHRGPSGCCASGTWRPEGSVATAHCSRSALAMSRDGRFLDTGVLEPRADVRRRVAR